MMAMLYHQQLHPLQNRTLSRLLVLLAVFFGVLGAWSYCACPEPFIGVLLTILGIATVTAIAIRVLNDLTRRLEKKRVNIHLLDQQLLKMSRLAATSKLSRDFLIQMKNVLINIDSTATLGLCLAERDSRQELRRNLEMIKSESVQAHRSIEKILAFTRPPENQWIIQEVDINQLLNDLLGLYACELKGKQVQVTTLFTDKLPHIRSNLSRLYQIVQNMLITVAADIVDKGELYLLTTDTGQGIEIEIAYPSHHFGPDVLEKLSDPTYALQSVTPGPWLVLSLYHAHRVNGEIHAAGTDESIQFKIDLPYRLEHLPPVTPRAFMKGL